VLLTLYVLVAGVLLTRLAAGTLETRGLLRRVVSRDGRLTSVACASPITVGWLRPVVVLPATWRDWSEVKLNAVLAHEHEHVRRRDPLVQWLALLNRAIFWFHPVAWWLERRLAALAEQACDDAVLAKGHDPREYSEYLLETARAVSRRARVNLAAVFMPGAFLSQRIHRILAGVPAVRLSRTRVTCVVTAYAIVSVLCVVASPVRASSRQAASPSRMVVRPVQPRWVPPESSVPQPVSLEWLDGDEWAFQVQTIITTDELVEYSQLRTPPARDAFIARFWSRRDPTPATPENEFREEFTRRVQFASDRFSESGQSGFGFDSDRGRVHLMFGTPDSVETRSNAAEPYEIWRYSSISELGADLLVRFELRRAYCGYQIASPAARSTVDGVAIASPASGPQRHASVQMYPLGLTTIAVPVDGTRVTGSRYELRNSKGIVVDQGEMGSVAEGTNDGPLSRHLPPSWPGLTCTHSLPPDRYTLTTAVRLVTGGLYEERATFDVR
jgi:GWxTD domain-containing protein